MVDLSNDRKSVETQILGYIRKEQIVPFRVLQHYSHLIIAEGGLSSGGSSSGSSTGTSLTVNEVRDAINNSSASKLTQAQVEAALNASNLSKLTPTQLTSALNSSDLSKLTPAEITSSIQASQLIIDLAADIESANAELEEIRKYLTSSEAKTFVDLEFSATSSAQELLSSSSNLIELTIQNKSKQDYIYITLDNPATLTRSLTLPPLAVVSYDDLLAKKSVSVITEGPNVPVYLYYISKV